jgi:hypothetical protein
VRTARRGRLLADGDAFAARIRGAGPAGRSSHGAVGLEREPARADLCMAEACNCGIIASSAVPCSTTSASPGANSVGSAIASPSGRPKSITPISVRATCAGIVEPPAAPTAITSRPCES